MARKLESTERRNDVIYKYIQYASVLLMRNKSKIEHEAKLNTNTVFENKEKVSHEFKDSFIVQDFEIIQKSFEIKIFFCSIADVIRLRKRQ